MDTEDDVVAWAKANRAAFEVAPLIEMHGSARIQVGFTIDLYARWPQDKAAGAERRDEAAAVWERLRSILESVVPKQESNARVEIEPMRGAAHLRPENEMEPEIALRARVVHGDDLWKAVTPEERQGMSAFEKKLVAQGLKAGHW
jgi:hypothetical protein